MHTIKGRFAGYTTDGVIVAASSPLTESVISVKKCEKNGAAAAILKTASSCRTPEDKSAPRRCIVRDGLFWAKSSYNREIMTIEEGEQLVYGCKEAGVKIPIAASVTGFDLKSASWLQDCLRLEAAGADCIQLDFFYIENLLAEPDFAGQFVALLREVRKGLSVPVMPKLNIGLPSTYASTLLKQAGIQHISLLDSIKTPPPAFLPSLRQEPFDVRPYMAFNKDLLGGGLSVFGSFMLPITAQYTETMAKAGLEVCAGGGVTDGESAMNLLLLGASSVQVATDALLNGYQRFADLNKEIREIYTSDPPTFFQNGHGYSACVDDPGDGRRHAKLDIGLCNPASCRQECARQAFCSCVYMKDGKPSFKGCEGCGLCAALCPCHAVQMARV